jgi:hypothetical protein
MDSAAWGHLETVELPQFYTFNLQDRVTACPDGAARHEQDELAAYGREARTLLAGYTLRHVEPSANMGTHGDLT